MGNDIGMWWIGPLLYADITYTYLALDSFTAFPINPFTVGCNGPTKLYPTLWLSHCMMVSGDYFWQIWCAWTTLLWWYYQTIARFDRDGFSRLFSKTLVCLNHFIWNLTLFRPDHLTSLMVSVDHSSCFRTTIVYWNHLWVLCLAMYYRDSCEILHAWSSILTLNACTVCTGKGVQSRITHPFAQCTFRHWSWVTGPFVQFVPLSHTV